MSLQKRKFGTQRKLGRIHAQGRPYVHPLRKQLSASQGEETNNADTLFSRFQNFKKANFCCLSHPSVVFGYVSPIKLIQWIPDNTDVKTIIDISHLEVKPVALCLISAKLLYVM